MLVGPNGKPVLTVAQDGSTGRSIAIYEHIVDGPGGRKTRTWGVEFKPSIEAFAPANPIPGEECLEPVQILADVITGLMRQVRTNHARARAQSQVQAKMQEMQQNDKENT